MTEKKPRKVLKIVLTIVILFIIAIAVTGFLLLRYIGSSRTIEAYLDVENGDVQVDSGKGWQGAIDEMELSIKDRVKTLGNGRATIVLLESIFVSLEENTEVEIKKVAEENVKIKQNSGGTWNKFTGLLGLRSYEVETPNSAAIVRGTEFGVKVGDDEEIVIVGEGIVRFESGSKTVDVNAFEQAIINLTMPYPMAAAPDEMPEGGEGIPLTAGEYPEDSYEEPEIIVESASAEQREEIINNMKGTVDNLKDLRMKEIQKKQALLEQAKKQYSFGDAEVKETLDRIDKGEYDDNELIEKAPVKIDALYKIKGINDEIKEQNRLIEELSTE